MSRIAERPKVIRVPLSKAQQRQLDYICKHYEMYDNDVILALIKREALKLSKKEEKK